MSTIVGVENSFLSKDSSRLTTPETSTHSCLGGLMIATTAHFIPRFWQAMLQKFESDVSSASKSSIYAELC